MTIVDVKQKQKGFTIIELLIVIVVIGILATLVLNAFSDAQRNARNAQRISAAVAYRKAIVYYSQNNNVYPNLIDPNGNLSPCLGRNYPDYNGDGLGDCGAVDTLSIRSENSTLMNELEKVSALPAMKDSIVVASNGDRQVGMSLHYSSTRYINGVDYRTALNYWLEGTDQKCRLMPLLKFDSTLNAFALTDSPNSASYQGYATCLVGLPGI